MTEFSECPPKILSYAGEFYTKVLSRILALKAMSHAQRVVEISKYLTPKEQQTIMSNVLDQWGNVAFLLDHHNADYRGMIGFYIVSKLKETRKQSVAKIQQGRALQSEYLVVGDYTQGKYYHFVNSMIQYGNSNVKWHRGLQSLRDTTMLAEKREIRSIDLILKIIRDVE